MVRGHVLSGMKALTFWIVVVFFLIGASCRSQGVRRHVDGASQTTNGAPEQRPHEAGGEIHVESSSAVPLDEEPGQKYTIILFFVWRTLTYSTNNVIIRPKHQPSSPPPPPQQI